MEIRINRGRDPDGTKLRRLLEVQETYEWKSAARACAVHLLALISIFVWLDASLPSFLPLQIRAFVLTLWSMLFLLALYTAVKEYFWRRRRERCFAQYEGTQKEP